MLGPSLNDYSFQVDNWGSTYSDTGLGTSVAASASTNTKGSNTSLLVGIAEDCYFLQIGLVGGATNAATKRYLSNILIDEGAGVGNSGASWTTLIANLAGNSCMINAGFGYWYGFPIYLPKGTAIGAAVQSNTASATLRHLVRVFGKPSSSESSRVGTKIQTLGASTGTTVGTTLTPGSSGAKGSYTATLGTLSLPSWWYQCGILSNDTTMNGGSGDSYFCDVAVDVTSKYLVMRDMPYIVIGTSEQACKAATGPHPPIFDTPSGLDVYVRSASVGTPDSSMSAVVYAVQG